jgi:carbamoyltransferase
MLSAGLAGVTRNGCVTLCTDQRIVGICEQERITRVRAAGFNQSGLPDEALDELLRRAGYKRGDVSAYGIVEPGVSIRGIEPVRLGHHFAHACSAFLPSPFESATVVVCDHEAPQVSVWAGSQNTIRQIDVGWKGTGFAALLSECAEALGFSSIGREQRMEALARLDPGRRDARAAQLFSFDGEGLDVEPGWRVGIERWIGSAPSERAVAAAGLQSRIGEVLVEFLTSLRRSVRNGCLCVSGSLFHNSYLNSIVKRESGFDEVFVSVNPGTAGSSVGAALHAGGDIRLRVSPFLGPVYSSEDIKQTLDNCKLTYEWASDTEIMSMTVEALLKGRLVAWFDGPMEWGPRALGARSIVANPFAPYVLDNLNRFLKHRDPWRGYALSGLSPAVHEYFDGPRESPFMECDFVPKERDRFKHVLPTPTAAVRIQTVGSEAPPRFRALLRAFGEATGVPIVVNTSFNGFREPIVCSPRDAVRVFFGSGLDLLVLDQFVISK